MNEHATLLGITRNRITIGILITCKQISPCRFIFRKCVQVVGLEILILVFCLSVDCSLISLYLQVWFNHHLTVFYQFILTILPVIIVVVLRRTRSNTGLFVSLCLGIIEAFTIDIAQVSTAKHITIVLAFLYSFCSTYLTTMNIDFRLTEYITISIEIIGATKS